MWTPLFRGETNIGKQVQLAVVVMLVDFMESISIAKALGATFLAAPGQLPLQPLRPATR